MRIYVCVYMYVYIRMYLCAYICMCVCMCFRACVCVCMCVHACIYIHVSVCVCVLLYMYAYVCIQGCARDGRRWSALATTLKLPTATVLHRPPVGLGLTCSKIYRLFYSALLLNLSYYSPFPPTIPTNYRACQLDLNSSADLAVILPRGCY